MFVVQYVIDVAAALLVHHHTIACSVMVEKNYSGLTHVTVKKIIMIIIVEAWSHLQENKYSFFIDMRCVIHIFISVSVSFRTPPSA